MKRYLVTYNAIGGEVQNEVEAADLREAYEKARKHRVVELKWVMGVRVIREVA